jgi:hypothetical protein
LARSESDSSALLVEKVGGLAASDARCATAEMQRAGFS